jgi:hypothetical protein
MVAVAWLETLGLQAGVGLELPANLNSWAARGFVCVPLVIGGGPDPHTGMRNPVLQVDCWACRPGSDVSPWGQAAELAEQVTQAALAEVTEPQLPMPTGYRGVLLRAVYPINEPREIQNDGAGFARVQIDLATHWTYA